jgi:hypothetical protein
MILTAKALIVLLKNVSLLDEYFIVNENSLNKI